MHIATPAVTNNFVDPLMGDSPLTSLSRLSDSAGPTSAAVRERGTSQTSRPSREAYRATVSDDVEHEHSSSEGGEVSVGMVDNPGSRGPVDSPDNIFCQTSDERGPSAVSRGREIHTSTPTDSPGNTTYYTDPGTTSAYVRRTRSLSPQASPRGDVRYADRVNLEYEDGEERRSIAPSMKYAGARRLLSFGV